MKGVHYIDLGQWPPALYVTDDKRAYQRFIKKLCGPAAAKCPPFPGTNAGCCQKLADDSDCVFLISVGPQKDAAELAGTLAHEATHAMRWLFEHIGEHSPGTETEAYLVEHIVRNGLKALAA